MTVVVSQEKALRDALWGGVMELQEMPKRIELVYKDALENISFIKKQEWIVAGYGLTVHAAVVAVWKQLAPSICLKLFLTGAIVLAAAYGIAVLVGFAQGLAKWRRRLDWIYVNYFDQQERADLALGKRPAVTEIIFLGGLSLTLVTSAIIVLTIVWS